MAVANKSICKSRAGHCNIGYVLLSASVRARRSMLSFCFNFNKIFSIGHLYRAGHSMNSLPSQILERYAPLVTNNTYIKFQDLSNLSNDKKIRNRRRIKILQTILFFIPKANPKSGKLMDNVAEWWLEIDLADKLPIREIGIDEKGQTLLINPRGKDLGLWTDEEITLDYFQQHFKAIELEKEEFENRWTDFAKNHS